MRLYTCYCLDAIYCFEVRILRTQGYLFFRLVYLTYSFQIMSQTEIGKFSVSLRKEKRTRVLTTTRDTQRRWWRASVSTRELIVWHIEMALYHVSINRTLCFHTTHSPYIVNFGLKTHLRVNPVSLSCSNQTPSIVISEQDSTPRRTS